MNAKKLALSLLSLLFSCYISAQVGVGNTNPQASLDISATSTTSPSNNDGILIPRMSNFPSNPGATRDGMLIFYTGTGADGKGFYYWNEGTGWVFLTGAKKIDDLSDGKSDNDGSQNGSSIFLGINAGASDDSDNNRNVGIGYLALEDNTIGSQNTAIGYLALLNNIDGSANTAIGSVSLDANTTGIWNTGIGQAALSGNVGGSYNTAVGKSALGTNLDGNSNVALGVNAIQSNTSGNFNTVIGVDAATGLNASSNTIIGRRAMNSYSAGGENVAIGAGAAYYGNGIQNTYIGTIAGNSVGTGERNGSVFLGYGAGSLEASSNRLYIENSASATPLIYGEFDTNILRTNGELQIGDPTGTGYSLPTDQGTATQVLTSNGNGTTQWANVMSNPQYPDGFTGLSPVLISGSTLTYTVPAGKNLYITNIFSQGSSNNTSIDGKLIQSRSSNVSIYTAITNPILVAEGEVVTRSNTSISINGFLVDALVEPITQTITTATSYTVPAGKILILLSGHNATTAGSNAIRVRADGTILFNGFSNTNNTSTGVNTVSSTSFHQPMFLSAGTVLSSVNSALDYNINGYLIDN